jgi:Pregnancy-associated plasma protein-A/Secretion system C-terminal sorting domain
MRKLILSLIAISFFAVPVMAQESCSTHDYQEQLWQANPLLRVKAEAVEAFIQQKLSDQSTANSIRREQELPVIKIPVVVHILYHQSSENIADQKVYDQIAVLNKCFRRLNSDTSKTPSYFKKLAADCEIEFVLATSDPKRRATTGIIHKYTPIAQWNADDKMKFSSEMGDDAWDTKSYLNIWVCNLRRTAGYASFPGGTAEKDGIVLTPSVFGLGGSPGYELGKTAVHEAGHWLGLRHIWGDAYCGDDKVGDTPQQGNFTTGCPTGIRLSCSSGPNGDMYMNYMDITQDACTNLFTAGQKERMRTLFEPDGERYEMIYSKGLLPPLSSEIPLGDDDAPTWLHPQLYPNPATAELTLDLSYDSRWIGKSLTITNAQGIVVIQTTISAKIQKVNISRLTAGLYFLVTRKEGESIKQKFIKM